MAYATPPTAERSTAVSQIDAATPKNSFGFRVNSQCVQDAKALHEVQYQLL